MLIYVNLANLRFNFLTHSFDHHENPNLLFQYSSSSLSIFFIIFSKFIDFTLLSLVYFYFYLFLLLTKIQLFQQLFLAFTNLYKVMPLTILLFLISYDHKSQLYEFSHILITIFRLSQRPRIIYIAVVASQFISIQLNNQNPVIPLFLNELIIHFNVVQVLCWSA